MTVACWWTAVKDSPCNVVVSRIMTNRTHSIMLQRAVARPYAQMCEQNRRVCSILLVIVWELNGTRRVASQEEVLTNFKAMM